MVISLDLTLWSLILLSCVPVTSDLRYTEAYETSKRANDANIQQLRQRSKELRAALAKAQKKAVRAEEAVLTEDANEEKLEAHVARARARYDTLRAQVRAQKQRHTSLKHELAVLKRQEAHVTDNPLTRQIRQLENRLDKAMIKFNEAQSIEKTYEQILARLEEERVGFDNQLGALESAIKAKQKDLDELLELTKDAEAAKDTAVARLKEAQEQARIDQEKRITGLRKAENRAMKRTQRRKTFDERQRRRLDLLLGRGNSTGADAEEGVRNLELEDLLEEERELRAHVDSYEAAFRTLQHATGVRDENEVIQVGLAEWTDSILVSLPECG